MKRALAFLICLLGALLPFRLRVLYSEALGWIAQFFHVAVRSLVLFIVRQASAGDGEDRGSPGSSGGGQDRP